jgi:hypothetical protein
VFPAAALLAMSGCSSSVSAQAETPIVHANDKRTPAGTIASGSLRRIDRPRSVGVEDRANATLVVR